MTPGHCPTGHCPTGHCPTGHAPPATAPPAVRQHRAQRPPRLRWPRRRSDLPQGPRTTNAAATGWPRRGRAARMSGAGCAEPTVMPGGADPVAARDAAPLPPGVVPDEEQHAAGCTAGPQRPRGVGNQLGPVPSEGGQHGVDGVSRGGPELPAAGAPAELQVRRGGQRGVDCVDRLGLGQAAPRVYPVVFGDGCGEPPQGIPQPAGGADVSLPCVTAPCVTAPCVTAAPGYVSTFARKACRSSTSARASCSPARSAHTVFISRTGAGSPGKSGSVGRGTFSRYITVDSVRTTCQTSHGLRSPEP